MPSEFGALALEAIDVTFEMNGLRASYVPPSGGVPVPCLVTCDVRDTNAAEADGRPLTGQQTLEVRTSEVAAPMRGGTFTLSPEDGNRIYTVMNRPQPSDPGGFVWKMWVT